MFGKPYSEYLRFQTPFLVAMAVVGVLRLGLSLAGQPDSIVKFASMTAVGFATGLLGLGILMPWLAYAAWHGYRETLDAGNWPALE